MTEVDEQQHRSSADCGTHWRPPDGFDSDDGTEQGYDDYDCVQGGGDGGSDGRDCGRLQSRLLEFQMVRA